MRGTPLLQTFVLVDFSASNIFPELSTWLTLSHILMALLKWHFPDHLIETITHLFPHSQSFLSCTMFFPHKLHHVYLLPLKCMLHMGRNLYQFFSPIYPKGLEQCLECSSPNLLNKYNREVDLRAKKEVIEKIGLKALIKLCLKCMLDFFSLS